MQFQGKETLITFGGAFSNHLHAVAEAGNRFGFTTVGIIRGEKPKIPSSTLLDCEYKGMELHFVSRETYRIKEEAEEVKNILSRYNDYFLVPEGGANELASKGCSEIVKEIEVPYDYFCVACGTGTTLAGLAQTCPPTTQLLGFPVLKGAEQSINNAVSNSQPTTHNWQLISEYHFGGYAKHTPPLLDFIRSFEKETGIQLEQVYTGKMLFGIVDLAQKGYFKKRSRIVALHTGGLQGRLPALDKEMT